MGGMRQHFHNFLTLLKFGEAGGKATFNGTAIGVTTDISGLIPKSLATVASQFLVSSAAGVWIVKTVTEIQALLGIKAYTAVGEITAVSAQNALTLTGINLAPIPGEKYRVTVNATESAGNAAAAGLNFGANGNTTAAQGVVYMLSNGTGNVNGYAAQTFTANGADAGSTIVVEGLLQFINGLWTLTAEVLSRRAASIRERQFITIYYTGIGVVPITSLSLYNGSVAHTLTIGSAWKIERIV